MGGVDDEDAANQYGTPQIVAPENGASTGSGTGGRPNGATGAGTANHPGVNGFGAELGTSATGSAGC